MSVAFPTPVNGITSNTLALAFPVASTSWGTPSQFGIFDSVSGGNLLYFADLAAPGHVAIGEQVVFQPQQLVVLET